MDHLLNYINARDTEEVTAHILIIRCTPSPGPTSLFILEKSEVVCSSIDLASTNYPCLMENCEFS